MINIESSKCSACGICGDVCPRHIPETVTQGGKKETVISEDRLDLCMECGHCEAVCPANAVHVDLFSGEAFEPLKEQTIQEDQLLDFLKQRRSVRRYKDKRVPRDILDRILKAAYHAPTGTGSRTTGVIAVDNPDILEALSGHIFSIYDGLAKALANPVARLVIRLRKGKQALHTLQSFVMPGMRWYRKWYREGKSNEILRDCPVLILFYAPRSEPMGEDNCTIAAYQTALMANLLGVGTCFNHLIPPVCGNLKVKELINLPDDREIYVSLTAGYPKYQFKRTIPRRLADVRYC